MGASVQARQSAVFRVSAARPKPPLLRRRTQALRAIVVDLAAGPGTPGWWRGLMLLCALNVCTVLLSPVGPFHKGPQTWRAISAPLVETPAAGIAPPRLLMPRMDPPGPPVLSRAVDGERIRLSGQAGYGLYVNLRAAGASIAVAQAYLQAMGPYLDFDTDLMPDARFDLIVEQDKMNATPGTAPTVRLVYAGFSHGPRQVQLLRWKVAGREGWYGINQGEIARTGMVAPVEATRISSGFGFRLHPLLGYSRFHKGLDYAAPHGAPIRAVSDGQVARAGWAGGYGQMVMLSHAGGLGTGYAHMSSIAVRPGQRVYQGQIIGYVGSTGFSTGPHLHFELYQGGQAVDPAGIVFPATLRAGPPPADLQRRLQQLLASAVPSGPPPGAAGLGPEIAQR